MFGLPAAALAMYHCVPKERREKFAGLFLGVAMTSFLTGITEPLEYMFLFVCPPLYVLHAFFDGVSFLIADLLNIRIGNTFSGGFIDFFLFGIMQGNAKTNWLLEIPFGIAWAVLYYVTFRFLITKFDIKTPGRDDDAGAIEEPKAPSKNDLNDEAKVIIQALGGADNIEDVDACITRLRVGVKDSGKVDRDAFKKLGSAGVIDVDGGIQAIFGAKAILYKTAVLEELGIDE